MYKVKKVMGKCESAWAFLGIRILLQDLVTQLDESNVSLITHMIMNGTIEDENEYANDLFAKVIEEMGECPENAHRCKEYLTKLFVGKGKKNEECLWEREIVIPIKTILTTDRWGYDRYGTNCSSIPIDFDLSLNTDKYKDLTGWTPVFVLHQHSG